jgi:hypothetical protein
MLLCPSETEPVPVATAPLQKAIDEFGAVTVKVVVVSFEGVE